MERRDRRARHRAAEIRGVAGEPAGEPGDSATAEALRAICELDLSELQAIEPPRGFGRD